jgi:acyl-CoA thioester hydrolase
VHEGDDAGGDEAYNHDVKAGWHVVPWNVIFRDLDAIGHVNNAVYFTYFEWGRTRYWFDLTGGAKPFDIGFIVARAECDFRAQLVMEPIEIATRVGEMRTSSIDFHSEIRKADGSVAATGKVVVVLYDWATGSKTTIPDELRRKVRAFQGEEHA